MTISIPQTPTPTDLKTTTESIGQLSSILNNSAEPLSLRFRALFSLKAMGSASKEKNSVDLSNNETDAINEIAKAFQDDSNLLKHEVAYVLGQMKDKRALEVLYKVLSDHGQDAMVRSYLHSQIDAQLMNNNLNLTN